MACFDNLSTMGWRNLRHVLKLMYLHQFRHNKILQESGLHFLADYLLKQIQENKK